MFSEKCISYFANYTVKESYGTRTLEIHDIVIGMYHYSFQSRITFRNTTTVSEVVSRETYVVRI